MGRETMATIRSATNPPSREQLLSEIASDLQDMTQHKKNPLSDFKLTKASDEEYDAFRNWLVTAEAAASAAKEGGFMGFKAVVVSAGEKAMLEQLRSTLDLS
jgi:hypothetical protein